jgi:hypothetical protein
MLTTYLIDNNGTDACTRKILYTNQPVALDQLFNHDLSVTLDNCPVDDPYNCDDNAVLNMPYFGLIRLMKFILDNSVNNVSFVFQLQLSGPNNGVVTLGPIDLEYTLISSFAILKQM